MKKVSYSIFTIVFSISILFVSCHKNGRNYNKKLEIDGYDGPQKAAEFEYNRTKDPATGTVPRDRMWEAIIETENLKNTYNFSPSSSNALAPLFWTERGSFSDAAGPFGNQRPGNGVTSGRMRAVWVDLADPTGKAVWVGGVDGGIWKTDDVTVTTPTWTLINDFLSNLAVTSICQDPTNTNTMYFSTGEAFLNGGAVNGNGVFKSTDHGITWTLLPSTSTLTRCSKILCDAAGNVYVSTIAIGIAVGLQRSTDGGSTWVSINPFTTTSRIVDFEISSTGAMHVSGGLFSAAGVGGYKYTTNPAAATPVWLNPTTPFPFPSGGSSRTELACVGNTVYASLGQANEKIEAIAKSTDGGDNWTTTALTATNINDLQSAQGWYSQGLMADPSNPNTVIVGNLRLLKSTDGGLTFSKISEWAGTTGQYVHADIHNITWVDNGNKLFIGTDGGLFYSTNKGTTFTDKNTGLRLKQFYGVAMHPTSLNYFLAGAQDNGTHQFNGPGLTTSIEVLGGDGGYTAIDQNEPQFQTGAFVYANFRRTTNGGSTWSSSGSANTLGQFINPYDYDNTGNKVYAGYAAGQFLRWENPQSGFTFTPVSLPIFGTALVASTTVSPYTPNRVYFGLTNGKIIQVDNADQASPTAIDITPAGIAAGYVNSVNIGISDQNLTITLTNYGVVNIWNSVNGGTSWVGCDGNLPDIPVYWALYHPDGDTKAYIATEAGVWSTDLINGASTIWSPETTFPTVKTTMLKYRASDRMMAAATYGRGLWTAIIPNITCTPASINSQPANTTVCEGSSTSFTITAAGTPTLSYQWQVSTTGAGGPWTNLTNTAPYSNVITNTLNITAASALLNTYLYRVVVTGNCAPTTATSNPATLTVSLSTTLTLTSPAATTSQTVTVNSAITSITYSTIGSVTGAIVTGLPTGVTGVYSGGTNGTVTISGTPTAAGTFSYTVTTSGGCGVQTATGTITAVNGPSIALTSSPGTNNQIVCVNTAINNIVYTAAGGVTGATVAGLPAGVTGAYSGGTNGTFTISGTPTATGTFTYTLTTSGGTSVINTTGTITVNSAVTLTLTSPASTTTQTVNINTPITNISYSTTGGVTAATVTGLPAGVTSVYSGGTNGTVTISGTPTAPGTFNYTVITTGGCGTQSGTGSITVVIPPSITLTSAAGSNAQTICIGNAITTISYISAGGVTGATTTGLPAGVTGTYSGGSNGTYTISGTPSATGTFNYTITTSGGIATATGSIVVNALPAAPAVTSPVTYCQGAAATALTATGSNLLWYTAATGGTGSATAPTPPTTTVGSNTYYVSQTINGCEGPRASIVVTVNVTPAAPTVTTAVTYCQGATAVALTATGTNLKWYTTATGGTGSTTAPIPPTAAAGSTVYYVSQTTGVCEGPRTAITVNVTALPTAPTVTPPVTYCQGTTATALTATGTGLLWFTAATGGTGSATAPIPSTSIAGAITYYVAQTNSCGEGARAAIVVNTTATPLAATNLTATNITKTSASLNWTGMAGSFYTIEYKTSTAATWTVAATGITANSIAVSNLTRGTTYNWRVYSNCIASGGGNVSSIAIFSTISRNNTITNLNNGFGLNLTPNPIQSSGILDYLVPANGTVSITILTANGQIVRSIFNANQAAGQYELNITNQLNILAKGTYILKIIQNGKGMSLKFIKD